MFTTLFAVGGIMLCLGMGVIIWLALLSRPFSSPSDRISLTVLVVFLTIAVVGLLTWILQML